MALAFVQCKSVEANPANTLTTTAITTTAGNLLVAIYISANGPAATPISDSKGNTWTLGAAEAPGVHDASSYGAGWYYVKSCTGGTLHTFTFHPTGTNDACALFILEISGADTTTQPDAGGNTQMTQAAIASSGTQATASLSNVAANAIYIALGSTTGNATSTGPTLSAGWTVPTNGTLTNPTNFSEPVAAVGYQIVSSVASRSATFTSNEASTDDTCMAIFTFKQASGGAADPYPADFPRLALNPNAWVGIRQ